ncbi:putative dj-1 family protein [Rosellinia necatrix]|uniref:Putative dj-1 family protein n=1 Tax=Rosellinia necatrix TaxID=77044 RepID=A0A1W2TUR7_ROSNE|nr:putative dj-1 family protein [Rosellinia necatrix]
MLLQGLATSFLSVTLAVASAVEASPRKQPSIKTRQDNETFPKNFGVVVFRAMLMQDMVGVVDPLQNMAHKFPMNLYILSSTMDPVTTEPASAAMNMYNSSFWPTINPTHTFATAPDDIEVLIVPGGPGVRAPDVSPMTDFIRDRYPKLRYLLTVCTGAGLAAKSGVLDGRKATTNKSAWATITSYGPNTTWVSPARWVVDGNIWSSSGATAGLDLTFAWIEHIWGPEWVEYVSGLQEYVSHPQDFDPFADKFNIPPSGSL